MAKASMNQDVKLTNVNQQLQAAKKYLDSQKEDLVSINECTRSVQHALFVLYRLPLIS